MNFPADIGPGLPRRPGEGHLVVERVAGESSVTACRAESPLKILTPRSRGRSVWAYSSSFGGGLVAGDEIHLDLLFGEGTRCFLGTQASTKVYRNPGQNRTGHSVRAQLEADSLLVLAPDPVQAFAGASYTQRQEFHLASGAGLVLVDWLCSGRAARGECWAFTRYQSRNEVFLDGERIVLDSILLDSTDGSLASAHRMGRFHCLGLVLIAGSPLQSSVAAIAAEIAQLPIERRGSLVVSASPVRNGILLRLAAVQVEDAAREIQRHLQFLEPLLGDNPWQRKW